MKTFPERLAEAAIAYHEVGQYGDAPEIRIISRRSSGHYAYDPERGGYWVQAHVFVPESEIEPEPGPTYCVWIAESSDWEWKNTGSTFTCDDDPDGRGARQSAHEYARYLRDTYHCAYVAVRPAGKAPLPVRPPLEDEPPFKDFSASWLGL